MRERRRLRPYKTLATRGLATAAGVPSARYADYSPVAGRPVVVWPDADKAGIKAGRTVVEKAFFADAFSVHTVPVEEGNGQDAADYSTEDIRRLVAAAGEAESPDVGSGIQGPPSKAAQYIHPDQHGLRAVLDYLRLEIRQNPRNLRVEIRRVGAPGDAKAWAKQWDADFQPGYWIPVTDNVEASLYQASIEHFTFSYEERGNRPANWTERDFRLAVLNNCPRPSVDPFRTWLEELPAWDGQARISRLWIDTLGMPDTELSREAGRRFLIGAVRRTYDPGCIHDWIPVLVGPQGLGKSSMLGALVSPAPEWFADGTQLDGTPKERMETTGPAVISEFSEMAGLDRADSASFKTYLSRKADQLRPAYGHNAQRSPRRWVGVGTANPDPDGVLPSDHTGARRYIVMVSEYEGTPDELAPWAAKARGWVRENLFQLWAEALHEHNEAVKRGGESSMNTVGHLRSAQEAAAEGFQRRFEGMQNVAAQLLDYGLDYERAHGYGPTIAELIVQAGLANTEGEASKDRSTQINLGKELAAAYWSKRQLKRNRAAQWRWHAPLPEGEALIKPRTAQGVCEDLIDGKPCGNPTRNVKVTRCDDCTDRQLRGGGAEMGEGPPPSPGPLATGLQVKLADIALVQEELNAEPESVAFLELQARAFRSLRSALPDQILTAEDVALLGGADAVLSIIEKLVLTHPAKASVRWETVNWQQFMTGWMADFRKSLAPSRAGLFDHAKARLQHLIHQRPLLPDEGAPA